LIYKPFKNYIHMKNIILAIATFISFVFAFLLLDKNKAKDRDKDSKDYE